MDNNLRVLFFSPFLNNGTTLADLKRSGNTHSSMHLLNARARCRSIMGEQQFQISLLIPSIPQLFLLFNALMTLPTSNSPVESMNKVLSQLKDPKGYAVFGSLDDNVVPIVTNKSFNFSNLGISLGC